MGEFGNPPLTGKRIPLTDFQPRVYTQAQLDAAVNEALERAAVFAARKIFAGGEDRSETASSVYRGICAMKKGTGK